MIGDSYWQTPEGRIASARSRAMTALRVTLPMEPRSKKSARGKHREQVRTHALEGGHPWLKASGGKWSHWPRPRADLALDVHIYSGEKNSPRIDTACKWLLDELGGPDAGEVVYADDRQVKWLFARKDVRVGRGAGASPASDTSRFDLEAFYSLMPPVDPVIHITAQTVSSRVADIRTAAQLGVSWPRQPERHHPFLRDEYETEPHYEYLQELDPSDQFDREELRRGAHELRYQRQTALLKSLDLVTPRVLRDLAWDPLSMYGWILPELQIHPFAFELGKIPEAHGETETFKESVRTKMKRRRENHPGLFPLLVEVGITILYFETDQGKDLDNLVRLVMPILLDELQPPTEEQPYMWPDHFQPASRQAGVDVAFLEAIALSKRPPGVDAGTAYLMLSSGWRHESWWEAAWHFVDGFEHEDDD